MTGGTEREVVVVAVRLWFLFMLCRVIVDTSRFGFFVFEFFIFIWDYWHGHYCFLCIGAYWKGFDSGIVLIV